jgi:hypothetical protein
LTKKNIETKGISATDCTDFTEEEERNRKGDEETGSFSAISREGGCVRLGVLTKKGKKKLSPSAAGLHV